MKKPPRTGSAGASCCQICVLRGEEERCRSGNAVRSLGNLQQHRLVLGLALRQDNGQHAVFKSGTAGGRIDVVGQLPAALDLTGRAVDAAQADLALVNAQLQLLAAEAGHIDRQGGGFIRGGDRIALCVLRLGGTAFFPYPFEIFSEISQRVRAYSGLANALCLSCANGYEGYLPTQDQLCRGGYEVGVFRYASRYALADNTDWNLIRESMRILNK